MHKTKGFTLIELLIVVAIIAILAAIAVPNFLEAQTRAKVARAKSDQRSLATAIESYFVDHGTYPVNSNGPAGNSALQANNFRMLVPLSTPIAYISNALLPDPFPSRFSPEGSGGDVYGYVSAIDTTAEAVIFDVLWVGGDNTTGEAALFSSAAESVKPGVSLSLTRGESEQLFSLGWAVGSQGPDRVNRRNEIVIAAGGDPSSPGLTLGAASFVIELQEWAQTAPVIYDPTNGTISAGDIIRTGKGIFEPRIVGL